MELEKVIQDHERMIYAIAGKFRNYYDMEDLYQAGVIGLLKAYQNFDDTKDTKFSTYAHTYIWGEILKFVREDKNIKVGKDTIHLLQSIDRTRELLTQRLMRVPTLTEIALFLEVDEAILSDAEQKREFVRSLDAILSEEESSQNLYNAVPMYEKGFDADVIDLHMALDSLQEDERRLIQYRYFEDQTQSEASKHLGMSQVQVSRSEAKILTKLQQKLSA